MKYIVEIPSTYIQIGHEDYDEQLFALSVQAKMGGSDTWILGENNCFTVNYQYLPMQLAIFLISKGCEVQNIRYYIPLTQAIYGYDEDNGTFAIYNNRNFSEFTPYIADVMSGQLTVLSELEYKNL